MTDQRPATIKERARAASYRSAMTGEAAERARTAAEQHDGDEGRALLDRVAARLATSSALLGNAAATQRRVASTVATTRLLVEEARAFRRVARVVERTTRAPAAARAIVASAVRGWGWADDPGGAIILVVSELVSEALPQSEGPIAVGVFDLGLTGRVVVQQRAASRDAAWTDPDPIAVRRGLLLDTLAVRRGTRATGSRQAAWVDVLL